MNINEKLATIQTEFKSKKSRCNPSLIFNIQFSLFANIDIPSSVG